MVTTKGGLARRAVGSVARPGDGAISSSALIEDSTMRLVAWNCNGGMHQKLAPLLALEPDIAIVSERAGPEVAAAQPVLAAATSHAWTGEMATKGLAVLTFGGWRVRQQHSSIARLSLLLDLERAGAQFRLLALWTQHPGYIEEGHVALDEHFAALAEGQTIVGGDLNSNRIWDRSHAPNNHSRFVKRLGEAGLSSAYHAMTEEEQGGESKPTFYLYRHLTRPFHIDFVFLPRAWRSRVRRLEVGAAADWLAFSDHMPVVLDLNDEPATSRQVW